MFKEVVPEAGLEPARYFYRGILSPLCLPIPPLGQFLLILPLKVNILIGFPFCFTIILCSYIIVRFNYFF